MVSFFVHGLHPKVSETIQTNVIGWEAKTLFEIVSIADHYAISLKQKWEEKTRLMAFQLHTFENLSALSPRPGPKMIPPTFLWLLLLSIVFNVAWRAILSLPVPNYLLSWLPPLSLHQALGCPPHSLGKSLLAFPFSLFVLHNDYLPPLPQPTLNFTNPKVVLSVGGLPTKFLVDTGAAQSTLRATDFPIYSLFKKLLMLLGLLISLSLTMLANLLLFSWGLFLPVMPFCLVLVPQLIFRL